MSKDVQIHVDDYLADALDIEYIVNSKEQIQIILFDLYDLRYTLSQQTKDEILGLEVTIGEHLNNIIESVEALETEVTA